MLNLKSNAMLMGVVSFSAAILVVVTLVVVNNKFGQQFSLRDNTLKKARTAVVSSVPDLLVCAYSGQYFINGVLSDCAKEDEAKIDVPHKGAFKVFVDIERGCMIPMSSDPYLNETREDFSLSIGDQVFENRDSNEKNNWAGLVWCDQSTSVDLKTNVYLGETNFLEDGLATVKMKHINLHPASEDIGDGTVYYPPDSVFVRRIRIESVSEPKPTCSISFKSKDYFVGDTALLSWASSQAEEVEVKCSGGADNISIPKENNHTEYPIKLTKEGTISCSCTPSNGKIVGSSQATSAEIATVPVFPACAIKFTQSKTDKTAITTAKVGETKGFWSSVSNFDSTKYDAWYNCALAGGGQFGIDFVNHTETGNDWKFNLAGEEQCFIGFYNKGVAPNSTGSNAISYCGTDKVNVSTTTTSPTCWMKAEPATVTVPATGQVSSTITWGSSNATKADAECTGLIPVAKGGWWPNMTGSNYPSGYLISFPASVSAGTEVCKLYLDGSATANCSVEIKVNKASTSTYSCTGTTPSNSTICSGDGDGLTADMAKTLVSACTTATKCEYTCNTGYTYDSTTGICKASTSTYSCTGTTPANATICSGDSDGLTVDVNKSLVSGCGVAKCEYVCNTGYLYQSASNSCIVIANASCGTADKTYSSASTSYGSDTFCSQGTSNPASPSFPGLNATVNWSCKSADGVSSVSCSASRSSDLINGSCGSANGDTFSSEPDSHLCSSGNDSSVSGDGPWYWTCNGVNGGASVSCNANKTTVSYSPTVSVIPVTSYSYSYTAKVAPTTGTATNVALLLSVSAVVTLGVWALMKKIKG